MERVNRHAAEKPVKVSPELFQLLSACVSYSRERRGFRYLVGPLMKVWGFTRDPAICRTRPKWPPPSPRLVTSTFIWTGGRDVAFDRAGVELDPAESARATPWTGW